MFANKNAPTVIMIMHSEMYCVYRSGSLKILVVTRGVPIIGTADISGADMLIFTVSVIGTDNQRCRCKCRYSACKINFYLTHAKEHIEMNHGEWFPRWFLKYFYLVS